MTISPTFTDERVDDVPILIHLLTDKLDLHRLFDQFHPRHRNWEGLSAGQVLVVWLAHTRSVSECTHTMSPVQTWANYLSHTLSQLLGQSLRETDLGDDRLAEVLRFLSLDSVWQPLERASAQGMIRVYHLPQERVRLAYGVPPRSTFIRTAAWPCCFSAATPKIIGPICHNSKRCLPPWTR